MKKSKKMLAALLALGTAAASLPMSAMAEESEKITISVTGGSEDSMQLNTATGSYLNGLSACRHLFEGLYKLDANGDVVLGQAASVETSEDGLTWTFTLRDDITWSDGEPVTADDFIFGFENLEAQGGDYSSLLSDVASSYEAPDESTVVITLDAPCSFLPSVLAFPSTYPVRADYVEEYGDAYATDPETAVYNGPYAITSWDHEAQVVMELREDYYDADSISVGTINWMLMSEESTALASFESGDIMYSDMCPDEEAARMEGNGLFYTAGNNNYCVMFNLGENGNDVLKDANVRKALSLAIDRERIISIRDLNDELGYTLACSGYTNDEGVDFTDYADPWYDTEDYEANCELAKELLAEAGYADGEGFPALTYIVNNDSRKEIAESVVNDWKEVLGIDTITVEKTEDFSAARREGNYDLAYFGWYMDYTDLSNMYSCLVGTENANSFYSSEEYTATYNAAISTADQAEQWEYYKELEAILAEDLPVTVIIHSMSSYLFDDTNYEGLVYSCGNFVFTYVTAL
ncbi:MAG: peptide ABC transporter substrate-binding protein [Lachnospiraceae bacterium]|nr:peptide ABC transporter substrate-binding protein [Lachnospiraceae bacterium]